MLFGGFAPAHVQYRELGIRKHMKVSSLSAVEEDASMREFTIINYRIPGTCLTDQRQGKVCRCRSRRDGARIAWECLGIE
jgi:hypothetical protein